MIRDLFIYCMLRFIRFCEKGLNMLIKNTFQYLSVSFSTCDVMRCKRQLKDDLPRVWLLLYDLYLRTFSKRKPELLPLKDKLFKESEMLCKWGKTPSGKLTNMKFK